MRTKRYYFSPQPVKNTVNRYISSFYITLSKQAEVVNYGKEPVSISLDILRYAHRCDAMILNWPEDIMHRRLGLLQTFILWFGLVYFRIIGGTIVWVCHNKDSHIKKFKLLRKITRNLLTQLSQYIIVHSGDAQEYFETIGQKAFLLPHPVYESFREGGSNHTTESVDVLIWGNIAPYKGLAEFIEAYKEFHASFKVLIIGKADVDYLDYLTTLASGFNISIENKFLSDGELEQYFQQSKIVLLPYLDADTFSSGSLIHSLNSFKIVIGPSTGNFIDLYHCGACMIYKDYHHLFSLINECLNNHSFYEAKLSEQQAGIRAYAAANSWEKFMENLLLIIDRRKQNEFRSENKKSTKPSVNFLKTTNLN